MAEGTLSELYLIKNGLYWIDVFRNNARSERLAMHAEALSALDPKLLPASYPRLLDLNQPLTNVSEFGIQIGRSNYWYLIVKFQGRDRPVLLREGILIQELICQLAGPTPPNT